MTENERVKELRKSLSLTMEKFGERLGVQKSAISKVERGENGVTDQMRRAICREFGVNEAWLTDGIGEMRVMTYGEEIAALAARYGLDEADQAVIAEFARLTPEERAVVKEYIRRTWHTMERAARPAAGDGAPASAFADIDSEVEDYRRQLLEEKKAEAASSALPGDIA
jgi:transcriptional regulator with XRE-family HTH domain